MNISSLGGAPSVDQSAPAALIMAKKALNQQKLDGQNALELIQSAVVPPTSSGKVNVYA